MTIYIANLDTKFTNEDLKKLFEPFGEVASAEIAMDAFTEKPRGFGFVEMTSEEAGKSAISELNKKELNGLQLTVEQREPKKEQKGSYKVGNGAVNAYRFRKN